MIFSDLVVTLLLANSCHAFLAGGSKLSGRPFTKVHAGQGFGREDVAGPKKTYGAEAAAPIKDIIDVESAMNEFFSANDEWGPLFRSIIDGPSVAAMSFIDHVDLSDFEFHETSSPWKRLNPIPTDDADREVLSNFLDSMQSSLLDIPVNEATKDDDNDLQFLEEGRRLLVCSRFHVVQGMQKGSIESQSNLFSVCWNEIAELSKVDETNTGSIIVVPGCDLDDLRRFADMNLHRPLEWLGIDSNFEVASLEIGSPAIRLIHKLADIPDTKEEEVQTGSS
jgi:hypothetical protein